MSLQEKFAAALFHPECAELSQWISSPAPASRFAVYRNNVFSSLISALADSYPVVAQLVGEAFFRAMALVYVQAHPPRSRSLVEYGESFAAFIEGFEPAASVPYLADIARLERLRVQAYHAADIQAVSRESLAELFRQPEHLANLRLTLHPGVSILASDYAVCALWQAHQPGGELEKVDPSVPELALVWRCDLQVGLMALEAGPCAFIRALLNDLPLGQAASQALQFGADFNLGHTLALLINKALIIHVHAQE